ncbi:hypothetical protein AOQ84DRAFT_300011 [Glonium stellatum]|uniref:U3 small nucleolar RNA-associated protein 6 N-terminal domain-containing protein n=1 Tax=Glonium stellatum TaxID=574774 RepID=A0A8E2EU50_9PEZI|nr:hypothetical protein AOQ84DRAFT_300011 [Glonium stellatum]
MAGASDKARFYLEQSIPELQELERKKIFTKEEISTIAKKRSDFEHTLNARGSHPSDYARYAEFETNLEALRRKRVKRLGVKASGYSGQKRIFFILSRATRKFHGDVGLWMQYIEFARKEKAYKRLSEILTSVLRLHPTKPELWIYAARYSMETQADITNARSYMQRGLRFCKNSKLLWLEYGKLEMIYIAKISERSRILGLHSYRPEEKRDEDHHSDMITLPDITAEDVNPSLTKDDAVDEVALQNLASAPVLTGAIPVAIFDAAMKQFENDSKVAEQFFNIFAEFGSLPCIQNILEHVVEHLQTSPNTVIAVVCSFRKPLIGVDQNSPNFPRALGLSLDSLNSSLQRYPNIKGEIASLAIRWMLPIARTGEGIDPNIKKVLSSSLRKLCFDLEDIERGASKNAGDAVAGVVETLRRERRVEDAKHLAKISLKWWSSNERLLETQSSLVQ